MDQCSRCDFKLSALKKELAARDAELRREKASRRHDSQISEEKLKTCAKREEHLRALNETLSLALQKQGPELCSRSSFLQAYRGMDKANQSSLGQQSMMSRNRSSRSIMVSHLQKQNSTPNRKGRRVEELETELFESRKTQRALERENGELRARLEELRASLEGLRGRGREEERFQRTVLEEEEGRRAGRGLNLIECTVCEGRFRPVQFMSHLQNCK